MLRALIAMLKPSADTTGKKPPKAPTGLQAVYKP